MLLLSKYGDKLYCALYDTTVTSHLLCLYSVSHLKSCKEVSGTHVLTKVNKPVAHFKNATLNIQLTVIQELMSMFVTWKASCEINELFLNMS